MLPLDAASVIGSIGGIAEIAREAFGGFAAAIGRAPHASPACPADRRRETVRDSVDGSSSSLFGDWIWWIIAAILLFLELMAPGVFFMWLAAAAVAVGVIDIFARASAGRSN